MTGDAAPLFTLTPEEQAAISADIEQLQRDADEWVSWMRSPEGRAWIDRQMQEATEMAREFAEEVKSGKYALSREELEQLRRDGILMKNHHRTVTPKKEGGGDGDG